jgi:phage shock protein A
MGLLERLGRLVRVGLNALLEEAEDPEQMMVQLVAEMQSELINLRQSVAEAIATQKRTERQVEYMRSQGQQWYAKAQLALQEGDETVAREALTRRQSYLEQAQVMAHQVQQQESIVRQLKDNMRTLERKIAETRTQKDMYIARARSAKASQRMHEMLDKASNRAGLGTFERMADKILDMEAKAAALAELNELPRQSTLEQKFAQLESHTPDIETQLQLLRAKLAASPHPPEQLAPAPRPTAPRDTRAT